MTPREAAKVIGCSSRHVRHLIATGKLQARQKKLPWGGWVYSIRPTEAVRFANIPQTRGYPRGRPRGAN